MVACGALAQHVREVCDRRGWAVDVHALPPLLHNRPERIAAEVEAAVERLRPEHGERAALFAEVRPRLAGPYRLPIRHELTWTRLA